MTSRIPVGIRGTQILKLLFDHGPLSSITLRTVIDPPMTKRKMNEAIRRLRDLDLIRKRHSSIADRANHYIELSQKEHSKEVLKATLDVKDEDLKRIPGGTEALEHWQDCVVWAKHFRTHLQNVKIFHDFQMLRSETIRKLFKLSDKAKMHAYPDLLVVLERKNGKPCTIAIEVERTQKKGVRIIRKLQKLALTSEIDGVVYICREPRVAEKIQRIYRAHVLPRSYRSERYAEQFLLISNGLIDPDNGMLCATDLKGSRINPVDWMKNLCLPEDERA